MDEPRATQTPDRSDYIPPTYEVISLDCEITAYAPDEGDPLF